MNQYKIIAFDADDTLFINEPYFDEAEQKFTQLMKGYLSKQGIAQELYHKQIHNLPLYGYGIKGYILSMIESALKISDQTISPQVISSILDMGKDMLQKPVELLPNIHEVLEQLSQKYKLIVATKGDLKDQHRKLHFSGLGKYFHHIEVMIEKTEEDYLKLLNRLDIQPHEFCMIGNSLKSDILPVLNIGGTAIHIPFETTWAHEQIHHKITHEKFIEIQSLSELLDKLFTTA